MNKRIEFGFSVLVVEPDELVYDGIDYTPVSQLATVGIRTYSPATFFDHSYTNPTIESSVVNTQIYSVRAVTDTEDDPSPIRDTKIQPDEPYACVKQITGDIKVRIL